ncbi:hypothetical protein Daus18300_005730 [Diaporthe australafricana]|uniref:C2H2-type domain-containing protein n=1 Tax=Diaporthe australafricana TaxID=127596 RepID=A0ABR3WZY1_9PEZI
MDSLRVKHVANDVEAFLRGKVQNLPNLNDHVKRASGEVVRLLLHGKAGYRALGVAQDYRVLATPAELAKNAARVAAKRWNEHMASQGIIGFDLVAKGKKSIAKRIKNCMTELEPYFSAHPEKMAAYNAHYRDVDAIVGANKDVEADGEPYELHPTYVNGQVSSCGLCGHPQADRAALESHHKAKHQKSSAAALAFSRCTECEWMSKLGRPGDLDDHLHSDHDLYPAGHADEFSTKVAHIKRKKRDMVVRLLSEAQDILDTLSGAPPPSNVNRSGWSKDRLVADLASIRRQVKSYNGWEVEVRAQRDA